MSASNIPPVEYSGVKTFVLGLSSAQFEVLQSILSTQEGIERLQVAAIIRLFPEQDLVRM